MRRVSGVIGLAGLIVLWAALSRVLSVEPSAGRPATPPVPATGPDAGAVSFQREVMQVLGRGDCARGQCHGAANGKGGFKLSLFGAEPDADFEAVTRLAQGRRVNRIEPARSLLLAKATGSIPHTGKSAIGANSPEYNVLLAWIAQGTRYRVDRQSDLASIRFLTDQIALAAGQSADLRVAATFADGSQKDATGESVLRSSDGQVATVDGAGHVHAVGAGECIILAGCLRRFAVARVTVPAVLSGAFPAFEPNNKIDELCLARWKQLGLPPSEVCTDEEFLRRVYLDVIGALPPPAEVRAFLGNNSAKTQAEGGTNQTDRRSKLIDHLLSSSEFVDYQALKWGDLLRIKSEYPVRLWPKAVMCYDRWLRSSLAANKPYDQVARELLTSSGSNFRDGPANYFRAVNSKDPQTFGESTALLFMGARLGCARCHGHPTENWSLGDDLGMAAVFGKVRFKSTGEWKEEIVLADPAAAVRHPRTKAVVKPKVLDGDELPLADPEEDPRPRFADWLTRPDNPWFARNIANRIWFWLMGRGIVHEPDDMRPTNPPSNPELLDYLARELVEHHFDLRHLFRLVLNSKVYQLSSRPNGLNGGDKVFFTHYQARRLTAEQLLDAISRLTETTETFRSMIPEPYTRLPVDFRAVQIFDGSISTPFMDLFGRPPRDTPYESDRCTASSVRQALYLLNSPELEGKIANSPRIKRMIQENKSDADIVDEMYLVALSRPPRAPERRYALVAVAVDKKLRAQAIGDLLWAIVSTKEFLFNH